MNFDLSWFTTIPGMLISCGVLLLLVALIVFIASSSKSKKKKNPIESETAPVAQEPPIASVTIDNGENVSTVNTPVNSTVEGGGMIAMSSAQSVPEVGMTGGNLPPVNNSITAPQPVMPSVEPVQPVMPAVEAVQPVMPAIPVIEAAPATQPVIYGGANPVVSDFKLEQDNTSHQIYGGANPLENTQSIPISSIASVQPVMPSIPTVESAQPTITPIPDSTQQY